MWSYAHTCTLQTKIDLTQVGDAMQKMHDRKNIGKVLLDPSLPSKHKVSEDR